MSVKTDWQSLGHLEGDELKRAVFDILQNTARQLYGDEPDHPEVLEIVPRLADLLEARHELASYKGPFNALARAAGLWNYIDKKDAGTQELLLAETVTAHELDGIALHREQIAALNTLLDGRNLILSAPTSFGKSLIIDALLATNRYNRVAIVLPTIALLDEFRRRLTRRFKDRYKLIMHPNEMASDSPTIFLGTQERLINRDDLGRLDLTVVDEFYKLDPNRKDDRSITLNAAVYRLLSKSKQFFFLGPNIDGVHVSSEGRWKFEFLKTRFSTVAVDTFDLGHVADKKEQLFEEISTHENWPALVFVSSPDKANQIAFEAAEKMAVSDASAEFASWLEENVGVKSTLAYTVRYGFGLHHGRIPRAIAAYMIRLFNSGELPVLFCTSTLIEGVNTAARTVLIYDKTINREDYDFFTYSNIKGRAGRLGEHRVGRVYVFNTPPEHSETEVAPTLFADEDDAPDDYVVHLDEPPDGFKDDRIEVLKQRLGLSNAEIKVAASVGLGHAATIREAVDKALSSSRALVWSGYPRYPQIAALVDIVCAAKRPIEFGAYTSSQLTYFINSLRMSQSFKSFLSDYDMKYRGDAHTHDNVFRFLRSCEYGLSQLIAVAEIFVKQHYASTDYSVFLHGMTRWFLPDDLKNLDEEGIPVQISERFWRTGDTRDSLLARIIAATIHGHDQLSNFERRWLSTALDLN